MRYRLFKQHAKPSKYGSLGTLAVDIARAVFWDAKDDTRLLAVLDRPWIVNVTPDGIRLAGYETIGFDKSGRAKIRYQEWWLTYEEKANA